MLFYRFWKQKIVDENTWLIFYPDLGFYVYVFGNPIKWQLIIKALIQIIPILILNLLLIIKHSFGSHYFAFKSRHVLGRHFGLEHCTIIFWANRFFFCLFMSFEMRCHTKRCIYGPQHQYISKGFWVDKKRNPELCQKVLCINLTTCFKSRLTTL